MPTKVRLGEAATWSFRLWSLQQAARHEPTEFPNRCSPAEAMWAAAGLPRMKELGRIARPQTAGLAPARSSPRPVARATSKTRARNRR